MSRYPKKRRKRLVSRVDDLNLTPMIDVVFQLLIYFIFTFEPLDVFTHLNVQRPAGESSDTSEVDPNLVTIKILPHGYMVRDRVIKKEGLEQALTSLAALSTSQTVLLMTAQASKHDDLVYVLNICTKVGLKNLNVVTTN